MARARGRGRGRGRGRVRSRPRLLRMHAAVDAMLPFGFAEEKVKKHVKELLELYGGDEGWPFLEECAYQVLIDSLLEEKDDEEPVEEKDDEEPVVQNGDPLEDEEATVPPDIVEPSSAAAAETSTPNLPIPAANRRTRLPCYGWIESDTDEDDEFICLRPASTTTGFGTTPDSTIGTTKKRRSRWDVKPGDP